MATYNGAPFLEEQLESILNQNIENVDLVVRDDGSTDDTVAILSDASLKNDRLSAIVQGKRLGVIGSFFHLLHTCSPDAEFIAFADQDDVWLPDKLKRARNALLGVEEQRPALYCSRLEYVDEELVAMGMSDLPHSSPQLKNALVENIAAGCTVMLNRPAVNLLQSVSPPEHVQMHDWWFYLVVSAFGDVIYDPEPSILYRQHSGNVVGAGRSAMARFARKVRGQLKRPTKLASKQAEAFLEAYESSLPPEQKETVKRFISAAHGHRHISYVLSANRAFRQSRIDDLAFRVLLMLGRI